MIITVKSLLKDKYSVELVLSILAFIVAIYLDKVIEVVIYALYFLIFLELTRAILTFIREQRVIVRYLVDALIIFVLREFIINVVKINTQDLQHISDILKNSVGINTILLGGVLLFMFFVRYLSNNTMMKKSVLE
ncbi:MAG: Unknown protein [uncultured Campylobacterales bacterium]|uniref:Phosphate-starvation-inducible E n=1 Tax=uncultured Campylobacterales bacterium TaxID=352960 RepID=A0A6S6SAH2_9BACT|nr:MAG: Unknown protein [uncultured Campylobacterales bacterium]